MGQGWSKFKFGHMEACNQERPEACISPGKTYQQSQATTEGSSSIPIYQGGHYSVSAADIEIDAQVVAFLERLLKFRTYICTNLSSLQGPEQEDDDDEPSERGKKTQITPSPSASQQSPLQAFLKPPEKAQFKKSQATPSLAACKCAPLKVFNLKTRPCRPPQDSPSPSISRLSPLHACAFDTEPIRKHQDQTTSASTSQKSVSEAPDDQKITEKYEETPSHSAPLETEDANMDSVQAMTVDITQPHSSAQKVLFFELDRKRKAPAGLPNLAVDCTGSARTKPKAGTSLQNPCDEGSSEAVLELGAGNAMVGMGVEKSVGNGRCCKGCVASYSSTLQSYQVKFDDGNEEVMEWLELEPCLIEKKEHKDVPLEEDNEVPKLRKSLRNRPRWKNVDELVYTKRKSRGRRRKK